MNSLVECIKFNIGQYNLVNYEIIHTTNVLFSFFFILDSRLDEHKTTSYQSLHNIVTPTASKDRVNPMT